MIAAVVSTFVRQLPNLPLCLKLLHHGVDRVIVCYNVQNGKNKVDPRLSLAAGQLADEIIYTEEAGQYPGEAQCTKEGLRSAFRQEYKYTLKINGDVFFGKPENIPLLIDELDGHDFIAPQWHNHYHFSSTMMFFGKTDELYKSYSTISLVGKNQLERRWQLAFIGSRLKWKMEPYAEERKDLEDPAKNGMWGELLGFRHSHGRIHGKEDLLLYE